MSTSTVEATPATPEVDAPEVTVPESRDWVAEIDSLISKGDKPSDLYAQGEAATETLAHSSAGLIPWMALAYDIHTAGAMQAAEFGDRVGADKNYLMRLRNAHVLYVAHREAGRALTPIDAMKVANVKTKKAVDEIAAKVANGEDPLNTREGIGVRPNAGPGNGRKGTKRESKGLGSDPSQWKEIVEVMAARISDAPESARADIYAACLTITSWMEENGVVPADHAA